MPDRPADNALRIGIDARLVRYRRGMGNYAYHLCEALVGQAPEIAFTFYVDDVVARDRLSSAGNVRVRVLSPSAYPIWEQAALPWAARRDGVTVLHSLFNTAPLRCQAAQVVTIHDVMYLMPRSEVPADHRLYQRLGRAYRAAVVPHAARRAAAIIAVSESSRRDIARQLPEVSHKVEVVHEAGNATCAPMETSRVREILRGYGLTGPFVLALGAMDPRKNTVRIVEAFAHHVAPVLPDVMLVMAGADARTRESVFALADGLSIADRVVIIPFVPDEHLSALYNGTSLFAYPSLYEGFGLPLLEAMACGAAVLSSRLGAIPEIAADAAYWTDPYSVDAIGAAMRSLLENSALRASLRAAGFARSAKFSWRQAADATLGVYRRVAGHS
jgi:glycosyltransferase involved in cell wall biosynthesis